MYAYAVLVLDRQGILLDGLRLLRSEVKHAIGEHPLPDLLLRFDALHREYRVESRTGYARSIQIRLATRLAGLALLEMAPEHPDILVQKWLDDEQLLVCGPSHRVRQSELLPITGLPGLRYVLREPE